MSGVYTWLEYATGLVVDISSAMFDRLEVAGRWDGSCDRHCLIGTSLHSMRIFDHGCTSERSKQHQITRRTIPHDPEVSLSGKDYLWSSRAWFSFLRSLSFWAKRSCIRWRHWTSSLALLSAVCNASAISASLSLVERLSWIEMSFNPDGVNIVNVRDAAANRLKMGTKEFGSWIVSGMFTRREVDGRWNGSGSPGVNI